MNKHIEVFCWMGEVHQSSIEDCMNYLYFLRQNQVSGIIYRGDRPEFPQIVKAAKDLGLYVEAWYPTLICVNKEYPIDKELFAVSKNLVPSNVAPPYVDYYRWLCPNNPKTMELISCDLKSLLEIKELDSIHLDYIRYCDVFLPIGLWDKYGLKMDKVFNEYDFCYCDICREKYKKLYAIDPISITEDSLEYNTWREFRYSSITNLVNKIKSLVSSKNKSISAAVFPGPSIAKENVLQEWNKWNLDRYYPMNYNTFYKKDGDWVGSMVKEEVKSSQSEIFSGIYLNNLPLEDFEKAVKSSILNGAKGVSLFVPEDMSDKHWAILKKNIMFM